MNTDVRKLRIDSVSRRHFHNIAPTFSYMLFIGMLLPNYFIANPAYSAIVTAMGAVMAFVFDPAYMLVPCLLTDIIQEYFLITETLSISRILMLVTIAAMILRKQGSFRLKPFDFFLFVFAGYFFLTTLWSVDSTYADGISLCICILLIVLSRNYSTREIPGFRRVLLIAAAAFGLLLSVLTFAGVDAAEENSQIVFAEELNANTVSGCLALMGVVEYGAAITAKKRGFRIFGYLFTALMAVTVLYVGSRTALLALVLTVLILPMVCTEKKIQKKVGTLLIAAVLLTVVLYIVLESNTKIQERFFFRDYSGELSAQRRYDVWRVLFTEFIPKHPLFGLGFGISNVKTAVTPYLDFPRHAHSMYIGILAETGAIGLILYFAMLVVSARELCRKKNPLSGVCFGMIIFGLILGVGEEVVNRKWLWIAFAVAYLIRNNFPREDAQPPKVEKI